MTDPRLRGLGKSRPPSRQSGWNGGRRHGQRLGLRGALVLLAIWMAISSMGMLPGGGGGWGVAPVPQALAAGFLLACIGLFRWSDTAMSVPRHGSRWLLWLPGLYLPVFGVLIVLNGRPGFDVIVSLALAMGWLALSEELMFRGLLFPALRCRTGIWAAIWISTLLFGVAHVANVAATGSLSGAIVQAVAATATGLLLLAIRLRRGSIWPAVLYHMLWNVCVIALSMGAGAPGTPVGGHDAGPLIGIVVPLALVVPNGLYGLYLMRGAAHKRLPGDPGRIDEPGLAPSDPTPDCR